MKYLTLCFLSLTLLVGCGNSDPRPSAVDYLTPEDNQTHHYRPIHKDYPLWTFAQLGNTLTLRTGDSSIKLSVRRNPNQVIIRKSGKILGHIENNGGGAQMKYAIASADRLELNCLDPGKFETFNGSNHVSYTLENKRAVATNGLSIQTIPRAGRFTITAATPPKSPNTCNPDVGDDAKDNTNSPNTCDGIELESPFSMAGTLLFQDDSLPLPERAALAWFITRFPVCTSQQ